MQNKYIRDMKVVEVREGEIVVEITLDTALWIRDFKEQLSNLGIEFRSLIDRFLSKIEEEERKKSEDAG